MPFMEKTFRISVQQVPLVATVVFPSGNKADWILESLKVDHDAVDLQTVVSDAVLTAVAVNVDSLLREWNSVLYPDPMDAVKAEKEN